MAIVGVMMLGRSVVWLVLVGSGPLISGVNQLPVGRGGRRCRAGHDTTGFARHPGEPYAAANHRGPYQL